ncbi:MAG: hypothetical protein SCM11_04920 [Bacillota bacterium]|nr:hypothetical protein [Bacillota bacterium]
MFREYFTFVLEELKSAGLQITRALPGFLAAVAVVVITILLAKLIKYITVKLLRVIGVNVVAKKAGIDDLLKPADFTSGVSELIGILVYWLLLFLGFTYALRLAGFSSAEQLLDNIFLYLPRIFVAIVILVIGFNIAVFLGNLAEKTARAARISYARWIGISVRSIVLLITAVSMIEQLNLNLDFIKVMLYILIGCAAVVATLIFGISGIQYGRDILAARIIKKAIQLGDQVVWNGQVWAIQEISPFLTSLTDEKKVEFIANTTFLSALVVLREDIREVERSHQSTASEPDTTE